MNSINAKKGLIIKILGLIIILLIIYSGYIILKPNNKNLKINRLGNNKDSGCTTIQISNYLNAVSFSFDNGVSWQNNNYEIVCSNKTYFILARNENNEIIARGNITINDLKENYPVIEIVPNQLYNEDKPNDGLSANYNSIDLTNSLTSKIINKNDKYITIEYSVEYDNKTTTIQVQHSLKKDSDNNDSDNSNNSNQNTINGDSNTNDNITNQPTTPPSNNQDTSNNNNNNTSKKVIITFNTVGGLQLEAISRDISQNYGSLPIPTRNGYNFLGWYTKIDGGVQITETSKIVQEQNHTLYAHWSYQKDFLAVEYPDTINKLSLNTAATNLNKLPKYERTYISQNANNESLLFKSPYYNASINNHNIPVYATVAYVPSVNSYAYHSFSTVLANKYPLNITLKSDIDINKVNIYPTIYGITPNVNGHTITFQVKKAGQYTIVLNNSQLYAYTIFVEDFIDEEKEIEGFKQSYGTNNVKVYEKGTYNIDYINIDKSNSVLYLKNGAYLLANHKYEINSSTDISKYKENNSGIYEFISSNNKSNIKILGHGLIDLSKLDWHERIGIKVANANNVEIKGITVVNSANWSVYPYNVDGLTIKNVKVFGYRSNSDAFAIANSRNVTVETCFARSGDDLYLVRALGGFSTSIVKNVVITDSVAWAKERAFGIVSQVQTNISDVTFKNCYVIYKDQLDNAWSKSLIGSLAIVYSNGTSTINNVTFDNILISNDNGRPINVSIIDEKLSLQSLTNRSISNVVFKNIRYNGKENILIEAGNNTNHIDVTFQNIKRGNTLITNDNYKNHITVNNGAQLTIK